VTTYVLFAPTALAPFQFTATLDGALYTVTVTWNFASQRWFISIVDQFGNEIVYRPLIGSPPVTPLTALSWTGGIVTALAPAFMGYRIGSLVNINVSGAQPAAVSGVFPCTMTGLASFTYAVPDDPGQILSAGSWSTDINLAGGWFDTSTLVFRASTQNFEISP
jgi:hypothetical protein